MKISTLLPVLIMLVSSVNGNITTAANVNVSIVSVDNKPLAQLVVYLLPLDEQQLQDVKSTPLVIYQAKKRFIPYISVVAKGATVSFSNSDTITHHIYSASANNRFSFRVKSGDKKTIEPLSVSGKILMGCNIHDWMSGYILVVDSPLYSLTNVDGQTTIKVPEGGRYQLIVWHPQLMEPEQKISRQIIVSKDLNIQLQLSQIMAKMPDQVNAESFDFLDDY